MTSPQSKWPPRLETETIIECLDQRLFDHTKNEKNNFSETENIYFYLWRSLMSQWYSKNERISTNLFEPEFKTNKGWRPLIYGNKRGCRLLFSSHPPDWERGKESLFCQLCQTGSSDGKESTYNAGGPGLIPGSGRSPVERNGNPLQYSCLENSVNLWATVHGVTKSWTQLSDLHFHFCHLTYI